MPSLGREKNIEDDTAEGTQPGRRRSVIRQSGRRNEMELFIFARFHARPGNEGAVAETLLDVLAPTREEPGCLSIHAFRSNRDSQRFYIHLRWKDEAAFEHHTGLPHTVRFIERVGPLIDHPLDVTPCGANRLGNIPAANSHPVLGPRCFIASCSKGGGSTRRRADSVVGNCMNNFRANRFRLLSILILLVAANEIRGAEAMKKGMANVNGTSLYYETMGKGSPLVFISSGGMMDRRCWDEQFESFAKVYRVIRYDVRGIGRSARPREPFSHSRDLYELLKFLKVKRAHLIALSVGGAIAIDFTLDHPEMVDRLILASSGVSNDAKASANLQRLSILSSLTKKEGIERVIQLTLDSPFVVSKGNAAAREKIRQIYLDNRDVFESEFPLYSLWQPTQPLAGERLSEIRARVLIIRGDNDSPAYMAMTDRIGSGINGSRKVVIPGGTHFLNLEKPKEFSQAVLEFLSQR